MIIKNETSVIDEDTNSFVENVEYVQDERVERLKEILNMTTVFNFDNKFYLNNYSETKLLEKFNDMGFDVWNLSIDSIDLFADISHGTTEKILNKYIGHFDETNFFNGNVGLAAHNRGYPVNYFENLDKVKIGDVIDYRIDDFVKSYKVKSINIIKDTDWTYLENTNDDRLTLITCVRNKPDCRLCVQAYKESEDFYNNVENKNAPNSRAKYNEDKSE